MGFYFSDPRGVEGVACQDKKEREREKNRDGNRVGEGG